jgi:Domain of unknown function (DUF4349)
MHFMKNRNIILLLTLCIGIIFAAGCTGLPANDAASRSQDLSKAMYSGNSLSESASVPPQSGTGSSGSDTKIINTAYITIEVKNVTSGVDALKTIALEKGGYLSSTNIQNSYNNRLSGTVIIRIPATEFENTLAEVKLIGSVKTISTHGQDVTEEYVDLQAQKTSYQNQLAQYNEIMKKAVKVEDVVTIQQQIDRVQTELNRLEGRMRYLNSQIDLSTISIQLQEPEPVGGESGHNFISTINEGIAGFFGMIDAIIIVLFTLLPLIILGVAGYGIYRWRKGITTPEQKELPGKK